MHIALDGSPLAMTSGGLRRYTESLSSALQTEFPEDTINTLIPQGSLWWSVRLPLRLRRHDLFHGTNFEVPYVPVVPAVMTIHDASPWRNAAWHTGADRVRRRCPALIRLGLASKIIVPTRTVLSEISALFDVQESRLQVVPEGSSLSRVPVDPPDKPFFLFLGTVEPRKRVPDLVEAWRPLKDRARLVIAGRVREDGPKLNPETELDLRGEVTELEAARLLSSATALVYPSEYEGFGLPVLEAMTCGTAVIASRAEALREVTGGDAALHVDIGQLREAMAALLDNDGLRRSLVQRGSLRAREFSWAAAARRTREVYVEAIERHRSFA